MKQERPLPDSSPIHIESLDDLRRHESAILRRLHALPNGGRLLMLDPLRCLRDLGVTLSAEAQRAWEAAAGLDLTRRTGLEAAYDGVARNPQSSSRRITFRRLLPGGKR